MNNKIQPLSIYYHRERHVPFTNIGISITNICIWFSIFRAQIVYVEKSYYFI